MNSAVNQPINKVSPHGPVTSQDVSSELDYIEDQMFYM